MVARLEDLCRLQIVIVVANDPELKKELLNLVTPKLYHEREYKVAGIVFQSAKKKAFEILKEYPVGLRGTIPISLILSCLARIASWAHFLRKEFGLPLQYCYNFLKCSFFTSNGMINKEIAAKELVQDTELDHCTRFCIACYYCFPDVVSAMWNELDEAIKSQIRNQILKTERCTLWKPKMVTFWCYHLLGIEQNLSKKQESFPLMKFKEAVKVGNEVAVLNCWKELCLSEKLKAVKCIGMFTSHFINKRKRKVFSCQFFPRFQPLIDVFVCLFPHLDGKQIKLLFQPLTLLYTVFYHLLEWPYQGLFINMIRKVWDILTKREFYLLLHRMLVTYIPELCSYQYNFRSILKVFWEQSPSSFKRFSFSFDFSNDIQNLRTFTDEDNDDFNNYFIELSNLKKPFILKLISYSRAMDNDNEIIRLILEMATEEEKSEIAKCLGDQIYIQAIMLQDLGLADLVTECLLPKEEWGKFKRSMVLSLSVKKYFWELLAEGKLNWVEEVLHWAINEEEISVYIKDLLSHMKPNNIHTYTLTKLKNIDKCLQRILLSEEESKSFKKTLGLNADAFARSFRTSFLKEEFVTIDFYLSWIFSSESELIKYKKEVAYAFVKHLISNDVRKRFNVVKRIIKWAAFTHEEGKDFKKNFAFHTSVIRVYVDFVGQRKLYRIDAFIRWTEMTKSDNKKFKNCLMFQHVNIISKCIDLIIDGKSEFIKKCIKWAQLSKADIQKFYSNLRENFHFGNYNFQKNMKANNIIGFFSGLSLSKEELKNCKNEVSIGFKNGLGVYISQDDIRKEVDLLLSWCFSSKKELRLFKEKVALESTSLCRTLLILNKDKLDKFLNWAGLNSSLKKKLVQNIVFDVFVYKKFSKSFVEGEPEIEKLVKWLSKYDLLTEKFLNTFLNWCFNKVSNMGCFYCLTREEGFISFTCGRCKSRIPRVEDVLKFRKMADDYIKSSKCKEEKISRKRTLDETSQPTKRNCLRSQSGKVLANIKI